MTSHDEWGARPQAGGRAGEDGILILGVHELEPALPEKGDQPAMGGKVNEPRSGEIHALDPQRRKLLGQRSVPCGAQSAQRNLCPEIAKPRH